MRIVLAMLSFVAVMVGCSDHSFERQLSIPRWKDNKRGAVSLTFDDWTSGHPSIVVPELRRRGMVGTFNVITGNVADWTPLREAVASGNEVANHSVTHPHPHGISFENEVLAAKQKIESEIPQQKSLTFAYPYGETTDQLRQYLAEMGYCAARGVESPEPELDFSYSDSVDYYDTKAFSVMTETSLADFADQLTKVECGGGMLAYLYHSVYSDSVKDFSYAWVKDSMFRQQLDTLMHYDVWIATYADMIRYHRQYKTAKLESVESNSNSYVFRLTTDFSLKNPIPMTIMFTSSFDGIYVENEGCIKVMQNDRKIPVKRAEFYDDLDGMRRKGYAYDRFVFDVIPNDGVIKIDINPCR